MPLQKAEKELVDDLLAEEGQHVSAVREMIEKLGGKAVKKGEYAFAFRDVEVFLRMSAEIETFAIGAYNGAISSIESLEARELACSIVQVEGRHAARLRVLNKEVPAPAAFDRAVEKDGSINAVGRFTGVFS
jgi:rubrerythrin